MANSSGDTPIIVLPKHPNATMRVPIRSVIRRARGLKELDEAANLLCRERFARTPKAQRILKAALRQRYLRDSLRTRYGRDDNKPATQEMRLRYYRTFESHCTLRNWVLAQVLAARLRKNQQAQAKVHTVVIADTMGFGCECPSYYFDRPDESVLFQEEFVTLEIPAGARDMPAPIAAKYRIKGRFRGDLSWRGMTQQSSHQATLLVSSWCYLGPRSKGDLKFYRGELKEQLKKGALKASDYCPRTRRHIQ